MHVEVSLFCGCAFEDRVEVPLAPRERELLLEIAAAEAGLDAERRGSDIAIRVLVSRIRSRFSSPILDAAGSGHYRIARGVAIDVRTLRSAAVKAALEPRRRPACVERIGRAIDDLRANPLRERAWFAPLAVELERNARALLAELTGNADIAALR